jgi:hypothetical protein
MQTALNHFPSDPGNDNKGRFNVVIIYEDFETGKAAKRTYDYLVSNLGEDCEFNNQMWKFDVLSIPKLAAIAVLDACEADIILVATHGGSLPAAVRSWLESWVHKGSRAIALVALCDGEPPQAHAVCNVLRDAAQRAGMQFFAHPDFWPGEESVSERPNGFARPLGMVRSPRNERTLSALSGVMLQDSRPRFAAPRWGLNE